ncbi:MAG: DUF1702 family protein [Deltaproteobacteria bacterium]|nr:DUF1702 family protein [Deltaproteobacteria bacterium]
MDAVLLQISSRIRSHLFGIDTREVEFARRGFAVREPTAAARLEGVARTFVAGYRLALAQPEAGRLALELDRIPAERRGFAYEGAGMALELLDRVTPWRRDRLQSFLAGPGEPHTYMVLIGAGWAWARLRRRVEPLLRSLDPVVGWLALDGYGFHEGFFHTERTVARHEQPHGLRGAALRVFDCGLGRSLWFVCCADPDAVAACVAGFPVERRADLWSGIGLACSYAGGVDDEAVERLVRRAGAQRGAMAQGAAFAAEARLRAVIPAEHTRRAVERIAGSSVELAAKLCHSELARVEAVPRRAGDETGFEGWRRGIRETLERGFPAGVGAGS